MAAEESHIPPRRHLGALEWCAVILLLVGGVFIPEIGWIVGVLLLCVSSA